MSLTIKILDKKNVYSRNGFVINESRVRMPNGDETTFIMRESGEFAIIIPKLETDMFVMVKQHRVGVDKISLEFPMGSVFGKNPDEMSHIELKEETGYIAKNMKKIGDFSVSPGWSNQKGNVYLATNLIEGEPTPEQFEAIEIITVSQDEIEKKILNKEIFDASTIVSFYLYKALFG